MTHTEINHKPSTQCVSLVFIILDTYRTNIEILITYTIHNTPFEKMHRSRHRVSTKTQILHNIIGITCGSPSSNGGNGWSLGRFDFGTRRIMIILSPSILCISRGRSVFSKLICGTFFLPNAAAVAAAAAAAAAAAFSACCLATNATSLVDFDLGIGFVCLTLLLIVAEAV